MRNSYTQLSFGSKNLNSIAALNDVSSISVESITPDRLKDFRLQLFSLLQTTLDLDQVLTIFHRQLKRILPVSGINYRLNEQKIDFSCGSSAKHKCSYQLTMSKQNYGDISFTRSKRFDEKELEFIESVMDLVIFPLKNALKYREALATAMIDPLTGLNNRGAMSITLNREIERARRHHDRH